MFSLSDIDPKGRPRLMDLVGEAGIDVSEWERSKRGASNPKYCYEWSFAQAGKVVVLCLWFEHLEDKHGAIWSRPTPQRELSHLEPIQIARAKRFVEAIQMSQREGIPIRAVISTGSIRDLEDANAARSRVRKRMLDPISWWVSSYDPSTDQYTLIRGLRPARVVDQFDLELEHQRRTTVRETIVRSADVRQRALERSGGKCEWCREAGFLMEDGRLFLETHHVIPLSENGPDMISNVVALCANHHREAHHGEKRRKMKQELLEFLGR